MLGADSGRVFRIFYLLNFSQDYVIEFFKAELRSHIPFLSVSCLCWA